ncbi:unnamed protein product [Protopolystoma xenopodis]|uniref:Uncharacterized protein n=1 Tax=Protopolystoma xenopodis TaxID=117903 RepID=A0A448WYE7_9PLAT|nr:unnamed protein product [Protopolystoma xenopodis]
MGRLSLSSSSVSPCLVDYEPEDSQSQLSRLLLHKPPEPAPRVVMAPISPPSSSEASPLACPAETSLALPIMSANISIICCQETVSSHEDIRANISNLPSGPHLNSNTIDGLKIVSSNGSIPTEMSNFPCIEGSSEAPVLPCSLSAQSECVQLPEYQLAQPPSSLPDSCISYDEQVTLVSDVDHHISNSSPPIVFGSPRGRIRRPVTIPSGSDQ